MRQSARPPVGQPRVVPRERVAGSALDARIRTSAAAYHLDRGSEEVLERPCAWRALAGSTTSGPGVRLVGKGRATRISTEPQVRLLGGFSVVVGDGAVADRAWRLRKAKALVKILALAPDRRVHRDRLAELLWPDRDADATSNNLHQALYSARRALDSVGADGAAVLALRDGAVVLDARIDVDAFEAAAARARADRDPAGYERALGLYGGELLPEDRYEPWADRRRAALAELHTALCLELAELHGDAPAAVVSLQRALVADPLAERAHRALMGLYARAPAAARRPWPSISCGKASQRRNR